MKYFIGGKFNLKCGQQRDFALKSKTFSFLIQNSIHKNLRLEEAPWNLWLFVAMIPNNWSHSSNFTFKKVVLFIIE